MRTNVILNDDLVREAMRYAHSTKKSALIEEALRAFVQTRSAQMRRQNYEQRLNQVQQTLATKRFRDSSIDILREDRERR